MSETTIYLAGPVMSLEDGGAEWRDEMIDVFGDKYEFRNPLGKYNVPADELAVVDGESGSDSNVVSVDEIVEEDKRLLRESDAVLVGYERVRSIGTPMEVMWARERGYPVAIWVRHDTVPVDDLSPWYRHHATRITYIAERALQHLDKRASGDQDD
ncbi:hypothetical protein [Natronoarchaeum rubrum]|uniref:hypothetical protein n=1 Tax=Natronoarchaeum rubrum TaxID=755311 RepID=UPI00211171AB|nr:hypothetical protein [Natronoarchaeum rubrum]